MNFKIIVSFMLISGVVLADNPFRVNWSLDNTNDSIALDKDEYSFKAENMNCIVSKALRDYVPESGQGITETRDLTCVSGKKKLTTEVFCTRNKKSAIGLISIGGKEYKLICEVE